MENKKIKLYLLERQLIEISKSYLLKTLGIILVYDISNKESFEKLSYYNKIIEKNLVNGVIKILVGNKCDRKDRAIMEENGEKFAMENNYTFFETSTKNNINVEKVFDLIVNKMLKAEEEKKSKIAKDKIIENNKNCFII